MSLRVSFFLVGRRALNFCSLFRLYVEETVAVVDQRLLCKLRLIVSALYAEFVGHGDMAIGVNCVITICVLFEYVHCNCSRYGIVTICTYINHNCLR